jgi:transposase-like protein
MKKNFNGAFKSKVALEALKTDKTMAELSSAYEVHRVQITNWRKKATEYVQACFKESAKGNSTKKHERLIDELYRQIGQLKVENEWLKKKCAFFG